MGILERLEFQNLGKLGIAEKVFIILGDDQKL